jgi:hypothetical protein
MAPGSRRDPLPMHRGATETGLTEAVRALIALLTASLVPLLLHPPRSYKTDTCTNIEVSAQLPLS